MGVCIVHNFDERLYSDTEGLPQQFQGWKFSRVFADREHNSYSYYFLNVGLLKRTYFYYFFTPFMVNISVINTDITNSNLSHVGPLWAASMYCIYTCLSDFWVLFMLVLLLQCVLESHIVHFSFLQAVLLLKIHHPSSFSPYLLSDYCVLTVPTRSSGEQVKVCYSNVSIIQISLFKFPVCI